MPKWNVDLEDGRTVALESDQEPTHDEIYSALDSYKPETQPETIDVSGEGRQQIKQRLSEEMGNLRKAGKVSDFLTSLTSGAEASLPTGYNLANAPGNLINSAAGRPVIAPYRGLDFSGLSDALLQPVEQAAGIPGGLTGENSPVHGIGQAADELASGLTHPDVALTLPAYASGIPEALAIPAMAARGAMAGDVLYHLPEAHANTSQVFSNPNSTTSEKAKAAAGQVATDLIAAGMTGAIKGGHAGPIETTPETIGGQNAILKESPRAVRNLREEPVQSNVEVPGEGNGAPLNERGSQEVGAKVQEAQQVVPGSESVTPSLNRFKEDFTNPEKKINNTDTQKAGMEAKTISDLQPVMDLLKKNRADIAEFKRKQKAGEPVSPDEQARVMSLMFRGQLPREVIEMATGVGGWDPKTGIPVAPEFRGVDRPLDWRKNPEVESWLRENAKDLWPDKPFEEIAGPDANKESFEDFKKNEDARKAAIAAGHVIINETPTTETATTPPPEAPATDYGSRYVQDNGEPAARKRLAQIEVEHDAAVANGDTGRASELGDRAGSLRQALGEPAREVGTEAQPVEANVGAAGFGETEPKGTALKNTVGELERVSHGLPESYPTQRRNMAASWVEAGDILAKDPQAGKKLADELKHNPERGMTDVDSALLLRHKVELENAKNQAAEDTITARTPEAKGEAQARHDDLSLQLLDLLDAAKFRGSQWGREGRWRQALAFEDYSLESMVSNRQAVLGRKLNPDEHAEVTRLQKKITETQKAFDDYVAKTEAAKREGALNDAVGEIKKKARKSANPKDIEDQITNTKSAIGERLAAEEKGDASSLIQKLARLFVEQGVKDRDVLIDKVHDVIKDFDPEFSRRQTMDAISGYGDFKQLSKDEISLKLRDLKGQMQQVAKLEDMQAGRPPLKTGLERRIPSAEESRLIEKVNQAKNEFQIPVDDPNTQLKSSLDMLKDRLKRETEKYQDKLKRGEFEKKPKRLLERDKEANRLHFQWTKAKTEWHEAMMKDRLAKRHPILKAIGYAGEVLNTSRAILTSMDLSAVLRQGGVITLAHPIRAAKAFPAMFKALRSKEGQHAVNEEILSRKNYPLYQSSKLYLSNHGQKLSQMEEAYMTRWAEHIPLVAASERAYVTFLNRLRADSFDAMAKSLGRREELTPVEAKAIANFINVATGRGNLGMKENALVGLNTIFFAPRYTASRFQLLAGQPLYRGSARTRLAIAKEYAKFMIGAGMVYALAKQDGAEVETDPRSADFGKLKYGNTRIDPMSGLVQSTVLTSRLASGETKNTKGKIVPIRGDKVPYAGTDSAEVMGRFLRTKLSPSFGTGVDILAGKNFIGQPVTPGSVAQNLLVPLSMQDIYQAMEEQGVPRGSAMSLLSILGMGLQTRTEQAK